MARFAGRIHPFVRHELDAARRAENRGEPDLAFRYL